MPTSPVTPSDIRVTIPTPSGDFCEKFLRFTVDLPTRLYTWFSSVYNEDGSFSDDFKTMVCAIDCTTVDAGGSSTIAAPTLTWSSGATPRMHWNTVTNAAYYELLRGTNNDIGAATLLAVTSLNFWDDSTAVASTQYYYWVRGVNATDRGPFSPATVGGIAAYTPTVPTLSTTTNIATHVELTWPRVAAASQYEILRNTSNSTSGATNLGTTAYLYFDDFNGIFNTAYYYFVRSKNSAANSAYTSGVVGQRA